MMTLLRMIKNDWSVCAHLPTKLSGCWDRWLSQKPKYQYRDHLVGQLTRSVGGHLPTKFTTRQPRMLPSIWTAPETSRWFCFDFAAKYFNDFPISAAKTSLFQHFVKISVVYKCTWALCFGLTENYGRVELIHPRVRLLNRSLNALLCSVKVWAFLRSCLGPWIEYSIVIRQVQDKVFPQKDLQLSLSSEIWS